MSKALITLPTAKAVNGARADLDSATLSNIATAAGTAAASLKTMATTATAIKSSISRAVLRVVSKENIADVITPLRETVSNAGSSVAQLSTIRTAVIKGMVAYATTDSDGAAVYPMLPLFETIAEAKEYGDACVTAAVSGCVVYARTVNGVPQEPAISEAARDAVLSRIKQACEAFGLSEDSAGKIRGVYFAALGAIVEQAEADADAACAEADAAADELILADAAAAEKAELETLREIAKQARRVFAQMGAPESAGDLAGWLTAQDVLAYAD